MAMRHQPLPHLLLPLLRHTLHRLRLPPLKPGGITMTATLTALPPDPQPSEGSAHSHMDHVLTDIRSAL